MAAVLIAPPNSWILSKLNAAVDTVAKTMEKCVLRAARQRAALTSERPCFRYEFSNATSAIYSFWQYELCDVYIELVKPVMNSAGALSSQASSCWLNDAC